MRTITFYSYKGGVGRSLLVANAAKYLSTLGKSVFAIDLDLEAPGLHYKFELGANTARSETSQGVVDILSAFLSNDELPQSLSSFTVDIKVASGAGPIKIMRAGTAPDGDYWRSLSKINWYDILYGEKPIGVPFFLELKERIQAEYSPDFLLIDARTGITEMGGIATTVMPDTVVCLGIASIEHLEGLRAVMRGIKQTTENAGSPVNLLSVISRLPLRSDETLELESLLGFLNAPVRDGVPGLALDAIIALHSEPLLDRGEQLLVGGVNSPHELPLLRDYLRLFSKIIPAEDIRPHVGQLIQSAVSRLLDDPEAAQSDLEALTTYCADQEAYRALLKLYKVRKAGIDKLLATASLMWQLDGSKSEADPLHYEIVTQAYSEQTRAFEAQKKFAEFGEAIWRSEGMSDVRIGLAIVNAFLPEKRPQALRLLSHYVTVVEAPSYMAVVRFIELLDADRDFIGAKAIVDKFKGVLSSPQLSPVWAKLVVNQKDPDLVIEMLSDTNFSYDAVRLREPALAYRLRKLVGDEDAEEVLAEALEFAMARDDFMQIRLIGDIFQEENRLEEFEVKLHRRMSGPAIQEIMDYVKRKMRRARPPALRSY